MTLTVTADADAHGFHAGRLARLDAHFARYVEDGRLAGWQLAVTRRGEVVHAATHGVLDLDTGRPVRADSLWRLFSMTKPITTVAAMTLWEEGAFGLADEVSRWIPAFADVRVYRGGPAARPRSVPATEPIRVGHLLTHTAGLTYGFLRSAVADALYRAAGYDWAWPRGTDLAAACETWARLPLLFEPGSDWGYSVATDVLGRLIEVVAGQPLDAVISERVLDPLGMADTRWWVDEPDLDRLATLYTAEPGSGRAVPLAAVGEAATRRPRLRSGGGGLVSSAGDYHRFTQMLLGGGALAGTRVLGSRTVRYLTRNHLSGGGDIGVAPAAAFGNLSFAGVGFGLGFGVVRDPVAAGLAGNPGEYFWGGAASTTFWVDPAEELTAMLFTQLLPASVHPLRGEFHQLVYQALVD
jgi:CubicO group peptidase (beta-lactamase class C family)